MKCVLEIKFTKLNEMFSVGEIVYQDTKLLEREVFEDDEVRIYSYKQTSL